MFRKAIARRDVTAVISLCILIASFILINGIANFLFHVVSRTFEDINLDPVELDLTWSMIFSFQFESVLIYAVFAILSSVAAGVITYKLRSNFKTIEDGQKGTSRFTTMEEIKRQYRCVPEKTKRFKGGGGVPISRHKDKIFIDDSPVNNLIIGTTRSGKGEMKVFPTIDIYSRAEEQASMILNDPKGELYAASKETLEKRGYHVEVLNLMNPLESMSYQILQLVIDAYKQKDMSTAQQLAQSISFMLYDDPHAKDKFWQNASIALCNALILALCDKCIKEGKEEQITMYGVANMLSTLSAQKLKTESGEETDSLDEYFKKLPDDSSAKSQYTTVSFAKGVTRASILANAAAKLTIFTLDGIAKMTSKSSFDLSRVGFGRKITGYATPLTRVDIHFKDGTSTIKTDIRGYFNLNFTDEIQVGDTISLKEQGTGEKTVVQVTGIDDEGYVTFDLDLKLTGSISVTKIEYFSKPTAIFMITPDYDTSLHIICSLFVKQLYTELSRNASKTRGSKCLREVIFLLDEFGNMPAIEGMSNMITVCLGRKIRFNLVIQAYSQLKDKYGDAWETIDGNCGNTIYILTTDTTTAEKIAKKLGDETIVSKSRSGQTLSLSKSKTESVDGRNLLNANELMQLQEGEMVVIRIIKRQDLKRNKIVPYPIFNTGEMRMKYRYEYLADDFDTGKSINDVDIACLHADVELKDLVVDFNKKAELNGVDNDHSMSEAAATTEEEQEEEQEGVSRWDQMNVNNFFGKESVLGVVAKNFSDDIFEMNVSDFMRGLDELFENGIIPENIYEFLKRKFIRIKERHEGGTNDESND